MHRGQSRCWFLSVILLLTIALREWLTLSQLTALAKLAGQSTFQSQLPILRSQAQMAMSGFLCEYRGFKLTSFRQQSKHSATKPFLQAPAYPLKITL